MLALELGAGLALALALGAGEPLAEPDAEGVGVGAGSAYKTKTRFFFASSFISRGLGAKRISSVCTGGRAVPATANGVAVTGAPGSPGRVGVTVGVGVGVGVAVIVAVAVALTPPEGVGEGVTFERSAIFCIHLFSFAGSYKATSTIGSVPNGSSAGSGTVKFNAGNAGSVTSLSELNQTYKSAGVWWWWTNIFFFSPLSPYAAIPPGPFTETVTFRTTGEADVFGNAAVTLKSPGAGRLCTLPSPTRIVPVAMLGDAVGCAAGVAGF